MQLCFRRCSESLSLKMTETGGVAPQCLDGTILPRYRASGRTRYDLLTPIPGSRDFVLSACASKIRFKSRHPALGYKPTDSTCCFCLRFLMAGCRFLFRTAQTKRETCLLVLLLEITRMYCVSAACALTTIPNNCH